MSFKCGILSLIILLNITVSGSLGETLRVTCSPQTICALRESTVTLQCSHSNTNIKPQYSFWFSPKQKAKWRNEEDPEDLALDSDYAGRVRYKTNRYRYSSTLTITELRERDSGEYHLMIITETGEKYSSSTAVTLMVSDLQMRIASETEKQTDVACITSCELTFKPIFFHWHKDGQLVYWTNQYQRVLSIFSSAGSGSYSCSISNYTEIHSNTVCVFDENCWSVTYSDRRVCALEGSSVDFPCTYSYPTDQTVTETFWYYFRRKVEPTDLSVEEQFAGRVEFLGYKERNCTLRMNNLKKSDSGEYRYRFITDTAQSFSGKPGVILSVTDLQVKMSPTITPSERQTVTLTCISTCTLPNNPTYIWYKNRPTRYNKLYLESTRTEDVLQYSCALGEVTPLKFATAGVSVFLVLILITGLMWRWNMIRRKRKAERDVDVQTPNPGNDTYTAINPTTMSSDYDTLPHVRSSSSEMYSSLNPETMMPDYDIPTNVTGSPKNTMP